MQPENYSVMQAGNGKPIKLWTHGVPVEDEAKKAIAEHRAIAVSSSSMSR